jgi:hypothetical protein
MKFTLTQYLKEKYPVIYQAWIKENKERLRIYKLIYNKERYNRLYTNKKPLE